MPEKRKVAHRTEAEFKKKAGKEPFKHSAVGESLDRMAGSSQDIADGGSVGEKLRRTAHDVDRH